MSAKRNAKEKAKQANRRKRVRGDSKPRKAKGRRNQASRRANKG